MQDLDDFAQVPNPSEEDTTTSKDIDKIKQELKMFGRDVTEIFRALAHQSREQNDLRDVVKRLSSEQTEICRNVEQILELAHLLTGRIESLAPQTTTTLPPRELFPTSTPICATLNSTLGANIPVNLNVTAAKMPRHFDKATGKSWSVPDFIVQAREQYPLHPTDADKKAMGKICYQRANCVLGRVYCQILERQ